MRLTNQQWAMLIGAGAFVVWGWWPNIREALDKINPASRNNVVYEGVNKAGAGASGNDDFALGVWAYNSTHDAQGNRTFTWPWESGETEAQQDSDTMGGYL